MVSAIAKLRDGPSWDMQQLSVKMLSVGLRLRLCMSERTRRKATTKAEARLVLWGCLRLKPSEG